MDANETRFSGMTINSFSTCYFYHDKACVLDTLDRLNPQEIDYIIQSNVLNVDSFYLELNKILQNS